MSSLLFLGEREEIKSGSGLLVQLMKALEAGSEPPVSKLPGLGQEGLWAFTADVP